LSIKGFGYSSALTTACGQEALFVIFDDVLACTDSPQLEALPLSLIQREVFFNRYGWDQLPIPA